MRQKEWGTISGILAIVLWLAEWYFEAKKMITQENANILLYPIGFLIFICIVLFIWGYWSGIKRLLGLDKVSPIPELKTGEIFIMERQKPIDRHLDILSISRFLFPLALVSVLCQTFYWVKTTPRFDISTILLSCFLLISSIWFWVDALFLTPRYYRLKYVVHDDIHYIFHICRHILNTMNATKMRKREPKLLKGHIGKSKIIIEIRRETGSMVRTHVPNDAILVIVRFDGGINPQNIDTFMSLFHRYAMKTNMM